MEYYLFWGGIVLVVIGYGITLLDYFKYKHHDNKKTAFDIAKDITNDFDDINIIEAKDKIISKYNLKRKVIKLTKNTYDAKDTFSLSVSAYLASLSLVKTFYLNTLSKIIPSLDIINKIPIILSVISYFIHLKGDAKLGIIVGIIILVYQYFYVQIINKKTKNKDIHLIVNHLYISNKIFFISILIFLLRFILILMH